MTNKTFARTVQIYIKVEIPIFGKVWKNYLYKLNKVDGVFFFLNFSKSY